jgi:hypothetical protein
MQDEAASGRFDPFAAQSANDRYLARNCRSRRRPLRDGDTLIYTTRRQRRQDECRRGTRCGGPAADRHCAPRGHAAPQPRSARRRPCCGLDEAAVACALDDTVMLHGDRRVDQVAAQRPEPGQRAILVGASEPGCSRPMSATWIAAIFRVPAMARPPVPCSIAYEPARAAHLLNMSHFRPFPKACERRDCRRSEAPSVAAGPLDE